MIHSLSLILLALTALPTALTQTIYDAKALVINARLLGCMVTDASLDACIDSWSIQFSDYARPSSAQMNQTQKDDFLSNIETVISLNSNVNLTWVADLNAFSHWTLDYFTQTYLAGNITLPSPDSINLRIERKAVNVPVAVDWSNATFNGETPIAQVLDQGEQGVSW